MNIQIFGTKKSADTRKAERFFKERGIKYQYIDLSEKAMSRGEFNSVARTVGIDDMIEPDCRDRDLTALLKYMRDEDREEKVFENQHVLRQPVVRSGGKATVGYEPETWKKWQESDKEAKA